MRRKYREYSDDDIRIAAQKVYSIAGLLKELNLAVAGGNYANIKRKLQKLKIDCSHWTGMAWNKGQQLKDWSEYTRVANLKPHLIKKRGHKCEKCGRAAWLGVEIPLEVDHKDGDRTNNNEENLELNCCNCHALTPTWRGRKNKQAIPNVPTKYMRKKTDKCSDCGSLIGRRSKRCSECSHRQQRKTIRPTKDELKEMLKKETWTAIGKRFGVSDNAVRKWAKQ